MATVKGNVRKRGKASWQLRVMVDGVPSTRTVKASTEAEANLRLAEYVLELGAVPAEREGGDDTVADLAADWWRLNAGRLSPATRRGYRLALDGYVLPTFGALPVRLLTARALETFYADLEAGTRSASGKGASASYVRNVHAPLAGLLKLAHRYGITERNVARDVVLPRVKRHDPTERVPATERVRALVDHVRTTHAELAVALELAAVTGGRRSEICGLRWSDVDLERGAVRYARAVVKSEAGDWAEKDETKGKRVRSVALAPDTVAVLEAHRKAMLERVLACGAGRLADSAYVFSDAGDCATFWQPDIFSERYRRAARAVGLEAHRLHDLRHFFVTRALDAGVPVHAVQKAAGHGTLAVTSAYSHARDADPAIAAAMGAVLAR
jgi:integrase